MNILINELKNTVLKQVINETLKNSNYDFKKIIKTIQNAFRNKDELFKKNKDSIEDIYHRIKLKNKEFI